MHATCQCKPGFPWYWAAAYYSRFLIHQPRPYTYFLHFHRFFIVECLDVNFNIASCFLRLLLGSCCICSLSHDLALVLCSSPPVYITCLSSLLSELFRISPFWVSFHFQLQSGIFYISSLVAVTNVYWTIALFLFASVPPDLSSLAL